MEIFEKYFTLILFYIKIYLKLDYYIKFKNFRIFLLLSIWKVIQWITLGPQIIFYI